MPQESSARVPTCSATAGSENDGHPCKPGPLSSEFNFASDVKRTVLHALQRYTPFSVVSTYFPEYGGSVPFSRKTAYCSGVSFFLNSSSVLSISIKEPVYRIP